MKYLHVYADTAGESHFEELETTFSSVAYAPPAPPFDVSTFASAAAYGFMRLPAGWYGDWHPVPRPQVHFYLTGEIEAQVSDGEIRRAVPGTVVLVDDTTGKGHISRVVSTEPALIGVVQLPD